MQRAKPLFLTIIVITLSILVITPASADGIIIPDPPICDPGPCPSPFPMIQLAIEYHRVAVTIDDQIATTHVDQVFRNDNRYPIEGTYVFPIPAEATLSSFSLWIDGEEVEGKVLEKEEARKIYQEIVRSMRDPALLEYMDRKAVQASIFPIPPGGKRRIELEYQEVLTLENGLIQYRYPLNTEKFSTEPLEEVSLSITGQASSPIRAIYSPSHPIAVERESEYEFQVGYEAYSVKPDKDFDLFFSLGEERVGLNLLTFRDPQSDNPDGFFLLLAAPNVQVDPTQSIAKDVILVLDRSGSMEGEKFRQAQQALKYVLNHLNPRDRFNIITFSTGTDAFANRLQAVDAVDEALRWVDQLSARGSTDINRALLEATSFAGSERPSMLIFLTDGLPTEGVTDSQMIVENLDGAAPKTVRLFAFGVGYDVDTFLLDTLAKNHHGATTYVTPDQSIDETLSGFYAKVTDPVLTDLALDFGEVIVWDSYPDPLPDLFSGSQLVLVGRYKGQGSETIKLSGIVNGEAQTFEYKDQVFRAEGGPEFLPRLWATRKIGSLLNQIRLQGPEEELVDQIVRLSIRYGIITPYTSFLVTEPNALGSEAQESIAADAYQEMLAAPTVVAGKGAVDRAAEEWEMGAAEVPLAPPTESADVVKIAGQYTFRLVEGVWIDTRFDSDTMTTRKVPFLSEDYFALADSLPDLATAFALGDRVIAVSNGIAYEIVSSEESGDPIVIPTTEQQTNPSPQSRDPEVPIDEENGSTGGFIPSCSSIAIVLGLLLAPLGSNRREQF